MVPSKRADTLDTKTICTCRVLYHLTTAACLHLFKSCCQISIDYSYHNLARMPCIVKCSTCVAAPCPLPWRPSALLAPRAHPDCPAISACACRPTASSLRKCIPYSIDVLYCIPIPDLNARNKGQIAKPAAVSEEYFTSWNERERVL